MNKLLLCSVLAFSSLTPFHQALSCDDGYQALTACGQKVVRRAVKENFISPVVNTIAQPVGRTTGIIAEGLGDALLNPRTPPAPGLPGAIILTSTMITGAVLKGTGMVLKGDNPVSDFARHTLVSTAVNKGVDEVQKHTIGLPKSPSAPATTFGEKVLNFGCKTGLGIVEGKTISAIGGMALTGTTPAALAIPAVIATVGASNQLKQDLPGIIKDRDTAIGNAFSSAKTNINQYASDFDNSDNPDDIDIFSNPDAAVLGIGTMIEGSKAVISTTGNLIYGGAQIAGTAIKGAGSSLYSVGKWGYNKIFG